MCNKYISVAYNNVFFILTWRLLCNNHFFFTNRCGDAMLHGQVWLSMERDTGGSYLSDWTGHGDGRH